MPAILVLPPQNLEARLIVLPGDYLKEPTFGNGISGVIMLTKKDESLNEYVETSHNDSFKEALRNFAAPFKRS